MHRTKALIQGLTAVFTVGAGVAASRYAAKGPKSETPGTVGAGKIGPSPAPAPGTLPAGHAGPNPRPAPGTLPAGQAGPNPRPAPGTLPAGQAGSTPTPAAKPTIEQTSAHASKAAAYHQMGTQVVGSSSQIWSSTVDADWAIEKGKHDATEAILQGREQLIKKYMDSAFEEIRVDNEMINKLLQQLDQMTKANMGAFGSFRPQ